MKSKHLNRKSEGGIAKKHDLLEIWLNKKIASLVKSYILIGIWYLYENSLYITSICAKI